jgi:hypothetical protein
VIAIKENFTIYCNRGTIFVKTVKSHILQQHIHVSHSWRSVSILILGNKQHGLLPIIWTYRIESLLVIFGLDMWTIVPLLSWYGYCCMFALYNHHEENYFPSKAIAATDSIGKLFGAHLFARCNQPPYMLGVLLWGQKSMISNHIQKNSECAATVNVNQLFQVCNESRNLSFRLRRQWLGFDDVLHMCYSYFK